MLFSGKRPARSGVRGGKLAPCPGSPNCVSSQSKGGYAKIEPLRYASSASDAIGKLKNIILSMPGTRLITEKPDYLYFEFKTKWMGFIDDVEFYLHDAEKIVHVRSASRVGYSDLGVNRKRIEAIRFQFNPR